MNRDKIEKAISILGANDDLHTIEQARNSVAKSNPVIGVKYEDGVVLVSKNWDEKDTLVDKDKHQKVELLTDGVIATFAGKQSDGRELIGEIRDSMMEDYERFEQATDIDHHIHEVAEKMKELNMEIISRPFGVELLIGGVDQRGVPVMYQVEPDGTVLPKKAHVAGRGQREMMEYLREEYKEGMGRDSAIRLAIDCLEKVDMLPDDLSNVEIRSASTEKQEIIGKEELQNILKGDKYE